MPWLTRVTSWLVKILDAISRWEMAYKIWAFMSGGGLLTLMGWLVGLTSGHIFMMGVAGLLIVLAIIHLPNSPLVTILRKIASAGDAKRPLLSPLKIEFDGTEPVRSLTEFHPLFKTEQVQRKCYGVNIYNSGDTDIGSVSVEVERIEQIPDNPGELLPFPRTLGLRLKFKSGETRMTFPPKFRERVPIISHVNSMMVNDKFIMESTQAHSFYHQMRKHRVHLKVTGSNVAAVTEIFTVWVDSQGDLQMVRG